MKIVQLYNQIYPDIQNCNLRCKATQTCVLQLLNKEQIIVLGDMYKIIT